MLCISKVGRCLFRTNQATETLLELVDTTTGIYHFLLAGEERMALVANVDVNVFAQRGLGGVNRAAGASCSDRAVCWMDI